MKNKPLVSIIIPTFNSEKTLAKCLESVKNQSYKNVEVIVIYKFFRDKILEIANNYNAKIIQDNGERTRAKKHRIEKRERQIRFVHRFGHGDEQRRCEGVR
ncbi:glycosyltransferase [bacterium]|nr:glycosyltransferase [bacterium]